MTDRPKSDDERETTMTIDDLKVGDLKQLRSLLGSRRGPTKHPYTVGDNYLVMTVTHYWTGRLVEVTAQELVLEDAAWIADTGRFAKAVAKGGAASLGEVEPCPDGRIVVGRGAVVAAIPWADELPRSQK